MENKEKYTDYVIYFLGIVALVIFMQTCGTKSAIRDLEDEMMNRMDSISEVQFEKIMSIENKVISDEEMKKLIKETPAWKTLRIEEISDKEHISINALEEKEN